MMKNLTKIAAFAVLAILCTPARAQKYNNVIDRVAAVVGNELITVSDIEAQARELSSQGYSSDRNLRCEILEALMNNKIFLMQARVDSLTVNYDNVDAQLNQRIDDARSYVGGDELLEQYFNKPLYKLRAEWRSQLEENSLIQQEQMEIAKKIPEITPYDVKQYLDTVDVETLPIVPTKYKMSQICVYPDRDSAKTAVKERLLSLRERIINGEKFATLARLYSEDLATVRRGGELGMLAKTSLWTQFSDAAMALKPGTVSQIVETPDGFHIIEVLEKKGDMYNARHILLQLHYTAEDREKAFKRLDSLRTAIKDSVMTFELAARYFSEDPASRTNGGQMADPNTGSAYFEIENIKVEDFAAVENLAVGEISEPIESRDNEGRNGNPVYKIIRLDMILPSHTATIENDYVVILDKVQQIKQTEAINAFSRDKIKSTYIIIDPLFRDCEFKEPGWSTKFQED